MRVQHAKPAVWGRCVSLFLPLAFFPVSPTRPLFVSPNNEVPLTPSSSLFHSNYSPRMLTCHTCMSSRRVLNG